MNYLQEELKNLKVMQEQQKSMSNLHQIGLSHATSQPSLYNDLYQQQQQPQFPQQMPPNQYGTLPHKSPHMFYGSPTDPMSARNAAYNMPPYVGNQPSQTFFPPQMAENVNLHIYFIRVIKQSFLVSTPLCNAKSNRNASTLSNPTKPGLLSSTTKLPTPVIKFSWSLAFSASTINATTDLSSTYNAANASNVQSAEPNVL